MPKISAPTVREHHDNVKRRLVEATEQVLRIRGPEGLSAGAVAKEAGIARNSIYRYVESVDDLKMLALEAIVPRWREAIFSQVNMEDDPAKRLADFAVASMMQTRDETHGWLMSLMRSTTGKPGKGDQSPERHAAKGDVAGVHGMIDGFMMKQWEALGVENSSLWAGFCRALIFESFKQSERGGNIDDIAADLHIAVEALAARVRTVPAA